LKDKTNGKRLLEVGCGTSYSVRDCLNPLQHSYFYVGTDIALEPLRTAKKFIKVGDFVQCVASEMPFRTSVFDVVLCLGVIHHLPAAEENALLLSNFVSKNGYFIAAENMLKESSIQHFLSRAFETKFEEQSPHENGLDKERFMKNVQKIGQLVTFHQNYSPVMTLLLYLTGKISRKLVANRMVLNIIFLLDQLTIKSLGTRLELLDGGQYFVVVKKK
jgi:ubiquinone/menaquinone biosynthesis C-methylase UbiE